MGNRTKLIVFMLLPIVIVAAIVLILYSPVYFGDSQADRLHAKTADELNRRMELMQTTYGDPDLFTLADGAVYMLRNTEKLKAFTVTNETAGVIGAAHKPGGPWAPNMANKLPPGTQLYRVTNNPELLAVKKDQAEIFYAAVPFDGED